jgi:hypothetical protein
MGVSELLGKRDTGLFFTIAIDDDVGGGGLGNTRGIVDNVLDLD